MGDGDGVSAAEAVMAATPCPIVLFTSHHALGAGDDGGQRPPRREMVVDHDHAPPRSRRIAHIGESGKRDARSAHAVE